MDIDLPAASTSNQPIRRIAVSESSPYDLDQVANTWEGEECTFIIYLTDQDTDLRALLTGRSKINRLLYVSNSSPSLCGAALALALTSIKQLTLDIQLYQEVFHLYRQHISAIESGSEQDPTAVSWYDATKGNQVQLDRNWLDQAKKDAQSGKEKLEVELKGYTTNLIKESIRVGSHFLELTSISLISFQFPDGLP